jgi:hypothetical protein
MMIGQERCVKEKEIMHESHQYIRTVIRKEMTKRDRKVNEDLNVDL